MSDQPHLRYSKSNGVATLTLNRPDRHNAISPEMMVRLADAWIDVRDDPEVRVALLEGAGDKSFCSGADLGRLIPLFTGAREADDEWDERLLADRSQMNTALLRGFDLYKPVVVAIHGHALAGGTEILGGEAISAQDAFFYGLVTELVEPDQVRIRPPR